MRFFSIISVGVAAVAGVAATREEPVNRPVSKVITLLKDMRSQLEKEGEQDQGVYDKMACWCKTNDKEKSKAIEDAQQHISQLLTFIEEQTARSSRLSTEIKNLEKEVAHNQQSLDKATAIRRKEQAAFNAEEKDLLQSVTALKSAIVVLSKHHPSMLQTRSLTDLSVMLKYQLLKHPELMNGVMTPSQKRSVDAFIQSPEDYLGAKPSFNKAYANQSGEIFGVLKNMQETFESNLSASQKEEMENQKAFEELKAAKESEIAAGKDLIETKQGELADADEKTAEAKEDLKDTKNSLSEDQKFLMMLKQKCQMTDQEWEARQKTRADEIQAVSEALSILSGDDAHDLFTRTFNFLQTSGKAASSSRRTSAAQLLRDVAMKNHSPRLAAISTSVSLDSFTRVKKAIDTMIAQLTKEKADEIKHKDWCVAEFHSNSKITQKTTRDRDDLITKIADLTSTIETLTAAIAQLHAEIAEMQKQLKRAGEDREKQNQDFQVTIKDQRETQVLLKRALAALNSFYAEKKAAAAKKAALVQEPAGPAPPKGFEKYEKSDASSGVIALITKIITDAKAMETEALRDEADAQASYEGFVKETNSSVVAKNKSIVNKTQIKAKAEGDLNEKKTERDAAIATLEGLATEEADLHRSCDFVLKNFEIRQTARDQEVEALKQAKAIISGADFKKAMEKSA